jgi:beta-lactamase superfamily II metal-dependent hydrolase
LGEIEILIDGGDKSPGVVPYLKNYIDGPLEVMIATHPHADHIGGLIDVLAKFEINEIWHNGDTSTSKTYSDFMSAVNAEKAKVSVAARGSVIKVDGLSFKVLNPASLKGTTNNNSIVLHLAFGEIDFLFEGDAEKEAEAAILVKSDIPVPDVEVLKVGHHGSRTASSKDFLAITSPEVAIYMAGKDNTYGHPHQETIDALNQIGAKIYGTDINGTIVVSTDGKTYSLQPERQVEPYSSPIVTSTPADFTVTNLVISPAEIEQEETVTISVTVTNSGGSMGKHTIILKVNDAELATKSVTLGAGESQKISFTTTTPYSGTYRVDIDGLECIFTVTKKVVQKQDLFLEIVSVTSPVGKGYTATLQAKTLPGASCTIAVYYKSGISTASGLYPKEADSNGNVAWSWKVGTRTTPGSWRIVVTASLNGKTVSQTTYFTVY